MKKTFFILICSLFITANSFSQETKTTVIQDPSFSKLLKEKQQMNTNSSNIDDFYKIQIYYGDRDNAKKNLMNFKRDFKEIDGTILYTNPTYKVWVGAFKLRIQAEKALVEIKKKYPTAFLIKKGK